MSYRTVQFLIVPYIIVPYGSSSYHTEPDLSIWNIVFAFGILWCRTESYQTVRNLIVPYCVLYLSFWSTISYRTVRSLTVPDGTRFFRMEHYLPVQNLMVPYKSDLSVRTIIFLYGILCYQSESFCTVLNLTVLYDIIVLYRIMTFFIVSYGLSSFSTEPYFSVRNIMLPNWIFLYRSQS